MAYERSLQGVPHLSVHVCSPHNTSSGLLGKAGFTHADLSTNAPPADPLPTSLGFSPTIWPCLEISSNFSNRKHLFS